MFDCLISGPVVSGLVNGYKNPTIQLMLFQFGLQLAIFMELNKRGRLDGQATRMQEPMPALYVFAITVQRLGTGEYNEMYRGFENIG